MLRPRPCGLPYKCAVGYPTGRFPSTDVPWLDARDCPIVRCMNKRILATFLWFNVGWAAGAMATYFLGLPEGLNIALAAIIAAVVWFDPKHVLWRATDTAAGHLSDERVTQPTLATE